jgi:hypothetical protein
VPTLSCRPSDRIGNLASRPRGNEITRPLIATPRNSRLTDQTISIPAINPAHPWNSGVQAINAENARAVTIISTPISVQFRMQIQIFRLAENRGFRLVPLRSSGSSPVCPRPIAAPPPIGGFFMTLMLDCSRCSTRAWRRSPPQLGGGVDALAPVVGSANASASARSSAVAGVRRSASDMARGYRGARPR